MNDATNPRPSLLLRVRDVNDDVAWSQFVEIYAPLIFGYCRGHGFAGGRCRRRRAGNHARRGEEIQSVDPEGVTPPGFRV